jgi:hypothetical protein
MASFSPDRDFGVATLTDIEVGVAVVGGVHEEFAAELNKTYNCSAPLILDRSDNQHGIKRRKGTMYAPAP